MQVQGYPRDMQDALVRFDSEAEQIIASFVEGLPKQPPAIIYHYTNDVGLRGILEGRLWLTDVFNLNDPSELNHGLSLAIKVLKGLVANGPPEGKTFADELEAFTQPHGLQGSAHFFICSFSSCGDDLCQWRAYADNGRGYAIGFDGTALEAGFKRDGTSGENLGSYAAAFPVAYNDAELAKVDRQIIEKMLGLISLPRGRNLQGAAIRAYMTDLSVQLMVHASHAATFFKHEAYGNEKEYRFLQMYGATAPPAGMKMRARRYSLIPYREFDWKGASVGALRKIIVGPAADCKKASHFATCCLSLSNLQAVPVAYSAIPYRAP